MPRYIYTAKSEPTKIIQGDIDAESQQDAINKITRMGYYPLSVEVENLSQNLFAFYKISRKDIVLFTRQFSNLIESGVNILNSLRFISDQTNNRYLRSIISDVISKVKDGLPLSESLAQHPRIFSSLYIAMIRSGEVGGTLEQMLKRLADFLEKDEEFKNNVRTALTYPFFVFVIGVLTVTVLLSFVIPRLVSMFEDMGQALPLPTKILINISAGLRSYWWAILIVVGIIVFLIRRSYSTIEGKIFWDGFKLKIKILGQIILKTEISRLMHTLSLLLSSGVTIISSLDISISIVGNQIIRSELEKFRDKISKGVSFSQCLKDSNIFPDLVTNIISIGEETGALEKSLMHIANDYEKSVDRFLKELSRLLEPVIILVIGVIVGFIVLAMLLPIFQINLIVK